jgi:rhodanese-related sulfurtransferase
VLAFVVFFMLTGCSDEPSSEDKRGTAESSSEAILPLEPEFESILPREASELLQREKSVVVVDVRTETERELLRIPNSIAVSLGDIMSGKADLPRDKPLLLVCAVGGRSYAAGLYLSREKYPLVYNLRGGILAWEKEGLPLEYGKR